MRLRAGSGGFGWAKRGREGAGLGHVRCGVSSLSRLWAGRRRETSWTAAEGIGVLLVELQASGAKGMYAGVRTRTCTSKNILAGRVARETNSKNTGTMIQYSYMQHQQG